MTREKAIKILENGKHLFNFSCAEVDENIAIEMAVSALRTQQTPLGRSKWEGCPACKDGEVIAWDLCNDGIVIESDGRVHMLSGGDWEVAIKFCPNCGRPLTEEAWAEPERRIANG